MKISFITALLALTLGAFQPADAKMLESEYIGAWKTMTLVDDMDDTITYVAFAIPTGDWEKVTPENSAMMPSISFRSTDGGSCNIRIPGSSFARDIYGQPPFFKYRIDKEQPKTSQSWEGIFENLILEDGVRQFAQELYGHKTLVVGTQDERGRACTITFDITGAEGALKKIAKAANWN